MSAGVAEKMQSEFRPTMQQMNETLESLKAAIVRLETSKQESVSGEIRTLMLSPETSLVGALSKMGEDFHSALAGAASQEFGNGFAGNAGGNQAHAFRHECSSLARCKVPSR